MEGFGDRKKQRCSAVNREKMMCRARERRWVGFCLWNECLYETQTVISHRNGGSASIWTAGGFWGNPNVGCGGNHVWLWHSVCFWPYSRLFSKDWRDQRRFGQRKPKTEGVCVCVFVVTHIAVCVLVHMRLLCRISLGERVSECVCVKMHYYCVIMLLLLLHSLQPFTNLLLWVTPTPHISHPPLTFPSRIFPLSIVTLKASTPAICIAAFVIAGTVQFARTLACVCVCEYTWCFRLTHRSMSSCL